MVFSGFSGFIGVNKSKVKSKKKQVLFSDI